MGELILQTSGTTGTPSFHCTDHARLAAILNRDVEAMELTAVDRLLTFCPLNHGLGLYAVLAQLSVGGGVILPHDFTREQLVSGLSQGATWMVAVPPVLNAIYQSGLQDARIKPLLSTLRFIRVGGAPLDFVLEAAFEQEYGVPVLNGYGCTEIPCITRNTLKERRAGSVGKPVAGLDVCIGVTQGHIWVSEDDGVEFDTGDTGHFDEDGFLYIDRAHKSTVRKTWKEKPVTC